MSKKPVDGDATGTPEDAPGTPGTPEAPAPDAPASDGLETARTADRGDTRLLGLIDQLAMLLDRSDLSELEVESGGTTLVLRKPVAAQPHWPTSPRTDRSPAAPRSRIPAPAQPPAHAPLPPA